LRPCLLNWLVRVDDLPSSLEIKEWKQDFVETWITLSLQYKKPQIIHMLYILHTMTLSLCYICITNNKQYVNSNNNSNNKAIVDYTSPALTATVHSRHPLPADRQCDLSSTCRRRTEPRTQATCTKNFVKIARVVPELSVRRDRHTARHTHHNTSQPLLRAK